MRMVVAGGGAAGFFGAIACAEARPDADVVILEKSPELLAKVAISGGGRCNVTHACFEPAELVKRYPRGHRELLGAFHRWQARDTVDWFEARGVPLKTEADGRMFPATDRATTITDCLQHAARTAGVKVVTGCGLAAVERNEADGGFLLQLTDGSTLACARLLLATGGNQATRGYEMAAQLGHTIEPPVPSLFTFNVRDPRLEGLAGVTVADARSAVPDLKLRERGPILVTHWGFSGPAILKLSAWGARVLHDAGYTFAFTVNWLPAETGEGLRARVAELRAQHPRKTVAAWSPFPSLPARLWRALAAGAGVGGAVTWTTITRAAAEQLAADLLGSRFQAQGKSLNKEEFVTCGGVRLSEVDFRTMASKRCPGLYFAGEILDIDGLTGGFNLQAAWTTGRLAGQAMGQELAAQAAGTI